MVTCWEGLTSVAGLTLALCHMAARFCGNGTKFDWLRLSCDISTCDLSPDENSVKYGRPMKSAIVSIEARKK